MNLFVGCLGGGRVMTGDDGRRTEQGAAHIIISAFPVS